MVRKSTEFICDLCDTGFELRREAEKCEKNHTLPENLTIIKDVQYCEYMDEISSFPDTIQIKDNYGNQETYRK